MPISISKTGAKLVKISGKHVFDAHFLTSFCCHFVRKRDKVSNICVHLTAKDFSIDDVNATLAEQAAKLQLTADETELVDSIVMLAIRLEVAKRIYLPYSCRTALGGGT